MVAKAADGQPHSKMDIVTHGLVAWVLARGFFSRRGRGVVVGMILAGVLADLDGTAAWFGPGAYLRWHRTYTHSLVGTLVVVAIGTFAALRWDRRGKDADSAADSHDRIDVMGVVVAVLVAVIAHLVMDFWQADGVTLFWPLLGTRFAADILPGIDAWILALLNLGIVLPELFRLVGSEIGAKEKSPRGRNGALVALALLLIYVGARYLLQTNAVAQLDAHAYKGETPRRVGAFADTLSIFTWHGVVETSSMMCTVEVGVGPGHVFDADSAYCQHKPEPSAALGLAEKTPAAEEFLRVARFPKGTVERREDGYEVLIRAVQNAGESEVRQPVAARVVLDGRPVVREEELVWVKDLGRR